MTRVLQSECDIEFEDVKFLRATPISKQEVELGVTIQKGTGRFEIHESGVAVVTGIVRRPTTKLTTIDVSAQVESPVLPTRDFYKELRLRGYQYQNLFRSVVCARTDGLGGKIKWQGNWVAFLDCLLQMQIVGKDTRSLMLPVGLRKVIIKPQEHLQAIEALATGEDEDKILNVFSNRNTTTLVCGGVEIRDLNASLVARRRPPGIPVLESYKFVAHISGTPITRANAARFCVQLALENDPQPKVLTVEVDCNDEKEPLCPFFGEALGDLPLVTGEQNYLTSRAIELDGAKIEDCSLSTFNNITFIIQSGVLMDKEFLDSASAQLKEGGYIVSRETKVNEKVFFNPMPEGFQIIAILPAEDEFVVLLQYFKIQPTIPTKIIKVTSENFDWLEDLKKAVQEGPVIAYSENDECSGIIGLVNCIRKEPNGLNLKCVFVDDPRAPSFENDNEFYKSHLEQGLGINVFKFGRWGTYRHLLFTQEKEIGPRSDHCYANSLLRGDLSSMSWLQGPYNNRKSKNLIRVSYASLNFRDVMLATAKLTVEVYGSNRLEQFCVLGLEYSGTTEENDRVMGIVLQGALATYIEPNDLLYWKIPDDWTLEEAATVPCVYATVYCAFFMKTTIEKGKSILIHAGTGGVGLAAIRVALAYGLEVYTTVSTEEKKNFLLQEYPQLKIENIGNSRDISFEDMVMNGTKGKGVDFVLNSLAGDKLLASVRCLGVCGTFLEIGKFDLANDTKLGLGGFMKELSFHSVLVDNVFHSPEYMRQVSDHEKQ